jgi:N-acetylglucosamine-6-phosphate deacetylase
MRSPGLLDLQVNGYAGVDFNDPAITADALDHALDAMLRSGVTACLPTLITAPVELLGERLEALDRAVAASRFGPLMVPGYHLEGPFLNPEPGYAGCHPSVAMLPPDWGVIHRLSRQLARPIILLTLAPELAGAEAFIQTAVASGRIVAIGHTAASTETVNTAVRAGATLSTHLGNGLPQFLPKLENPIFAQLAEDRLHASLIADGIHIPPRALTAMVRAKSADRSILVSDATAAATAPPGSYSFAGMLIEHTPEGAVVLPGTNRLAGSALPLDTAARNIVAWGIAPAHDALRMASSVPRALLQSALAHLNITITESAVTWSDDLYPAEVRVANITHRYR